jgi:hypothetical protein
VNDFIAEAPLMGAAYAAQQDWDVTIWFDISSAAPGSHMSNEFDMANKTHLFAQWPAAALMFYRRDLKPLAQTLVGKSTPKALLTGTPLSASVNLADSLDIRLKVEIGNGSLPVSTPDEYPKRIATQNMI